jgi:hypothetical protein
MVKIAYTSVANTPEETLRQNAAVNAARGLPKLGARPLAPRLAVVGGGASAARNIGYLRAWNGEVWAINSAYAWCVAHGIKARFYAVDGRPVIASLAKGATQAVVSLRCAPETFAALEGADVETIDADMTHGPSAATTAALVGIACGHRHISFFGCESSLSDAPNGPAASPQDYSEKLLIAAHGGQYLTNPGLLMQAEHLAEIIRAAPHVYETRSGGLLAALVLDPDYDVVAATRGVHQAIGLAS